MSNKKSKQILSSIISIVVYKVLFDLSLVITFFVSQQTYGDTRWQVWLESYVLAFTDNFYELASFCFQSLTSLFWWLPTIFLEYFSWLTNLDFYLYVLPQFALLCIVKGIITRLFFKKKFVVSESDEVENSAVESSFRDLAVKLSFIYSLPMLAYGAGIGFFIVLLIKTFGELPQENAYLPMTMMACYVIGFIVIYNKLMEFAVIYKNSDETKSVLFRYMFDAAGKIATNLLAESKASLQKNAENQSELRHKISQEDRKFHGNSSAYREELSRSHGVTGDLIFMLIFSLHYCVNFIIYLILKSMGFAKKLPFGKAQ
tara:strand:- start:160 stop:1107 length:948 start_codon:yes stop_codon:yes gene_type:complete